MIFQSKMGKINSLTYNKYNSVAMSSNKDKNIASYESENDSSESYSLFNKNTKTISTLRSTKESIDSKTTDESKQALCGGTHCTKEAEQLEGLESGYNTLITQNETSKQPHFTILNENIRSLIDRKAKQKNNKIIVQKKPSSMGNTLLEEVPIIDLTHILKNSTNSRSEHCRNTVNQEFDLKKWIESQSSSSNEQTDTIDSVPDEECRPVNIIPDKFRAKKLPHLDKKIRTGYVKFFDDRNNFGFMNLTTEPFGEVFVFGREFEKANICPKFVSIASNNTEIKFKFRVMYYKGKHGESKKAVNIRISNC